MIRLLRGILYAKSQGLLQCMMLDGYGSEGYWCYIAGVNLLSEWTRFILTILKHFVIISKTSGVYDTDIKGQGPDEIR